MARRLRSASLFTKSNQMNFIACPGCGGFFPDITGPTHRYMESSAGCWAVYGEVLAREYSDRAYFQIHRLTVDTYAAQHPGQPSPQSIKSVGIHLIRLHLLLERNLAMEQANQAMLIINQQKANFIWLAPPSVSPSLNVSDIYQAQNVEEHRQLVREWALEVWNLWSAHHDTIRRWAPSENIHQKRLVS